MTKKLQELFDLPQDTNDSENELLEPVSDYQEITETAYSNLEKIEAALPQVRGLESADSELDELAELATNSFKDLQDLGMQVESLVLTDASILNPGPNWVSLHSSKNKTNSVYTSR